MKIWIVNHYAIPPTSSGGTRHYNLARQLQERGHEVVIIAASYNHFSQTFIETKSKIGELDLTHSVPFVWIPVPAYTGNTIARFKNMLAFAFKITQKKYLPRTTPPDIIIGSSPHLFAAFGAERLAKKLKKPFILEIRDLWPESLVDLGKFTHKHPLIKLMQWIEKYLYRRATHVISLLPAATDYLIKAGVKRENISWIPNSVDIKNIPPQFPTKSSQKKFTVMYAGAHGLANDLDTVVAAAKILKEKGLSETLRICLIGDGPEKNRLQQLTRAEQINMIDFLPSVAKHTIYNMLHQADAYLMLLKKSPVFRWGISPNKLFDYLAMARPVIFGVETPFDPIANANAGISISPSDPQALADAIYTLSKTPTDELTAMGQRGREFVLQNHDVELLAEKLEGVLERCR